MNYSLQVHVVRDAKDWIREEFQSCVDPSNCNLHSEVWSKWKVHFVFPAGFFSIEIVLFSSQLWSCICPENSICVVLTQFWGFYRYSCVLLMYTEADAVAEAWVYLLFSGNQETLWNLDWIWELSPYKIIVPLASGPGRIIGGGGWLSFRNHTAGINYIMFC